MRELEIKKATEREEQLKAMSAYLKSMGVDAQIVEESATDSCGEGISESVIRLRGQSINKIRLLSTAYIAYGTVVSTSRFAYEVNLGDMAGDKLNGKMDAKTKPVKDNKFLGAFGGEVVDIKWVGHDLADRLNKDSELTRAMFECAGSLGSSEIEIQSRGSSMIEISGPKFTESPQFLESEASAKKAVLNDGDKLFNFEIYDRIAKNIREVSSVAG